MNACQEKGQMIERFRRQRATVAFILFITASRLGLTCLIPALMIQSIPNCWVKNAQ